MGPIKTTSITIATVLAMSVYGSSAEDLSGSVLQDALKSGGYIIYLRHTKTNMELADKSLVVIGDCTTQRPLSEDGRKQAARIGEHFTKADIKVSQVFSSPYCRAMDTAALAFPTTARKSADALYYSLNLPKDRAAQAAAELKKLLATKPAPGTNIVLVGHTSNLKDAAGIWPKKEGSAVVFRPDGQSFEVVGVLEAAELVAAK